MVDLTRIKEGMTVFDMSGDKIGKVEYVQFGDEDPNRPGAETSTTQQNAYENNDNIVRAFAKALVDEQDNVPEELQKRLVRYGYVRLDTGNLFESDYYIPMNLVANVAGDNVHINATKDTLVSA